MKAWIILLITCLAGTMPAVSEALTAQEVLLLKQNGVSEATIQMMLQSEMQVRSIQAGADGDRMGIRTIVRPGGQPAIVYATGSGDRDHRTAEERRKEERAWEMLRHLIVDTRTAND
jgi:hypothetical protein